MRAGSTHLLMNVTSNAVKTGHISTAIASLVLTTISHQNCNTNSTKQISLALAALEDALQFAEPGFYVVGYFWMKVDRCSC